VIRGTVADPLSFSSADAARESHVFDLRVEMLAGAGPGSPGYIAIRRHSWRFVSWWSAWPLNPTSPAMLGGSGFGPLPLSEARVNWPLGDTEFLRVVNPYLGTPGAWWLPVTGTSFLALTLHNAPLDARAIRLQPFSAYRRVVCSPGPTRLISWGRDATPAIFPLVDFATGYAPYRRLRVRMTPVTLPDTATVNWFGLPALSQAVPASGDLTVDPVAYDSADVIFNDNAGASPTIDVLVWFDTL